MNRRKTKLLQSFVTLFSGIITFGLAWFLFSKYKLTEGILILGASIILFISAGVLKITFKIDELKEEIKKNRKEI